MRIFSFFIVFALFITKVLSQNIYYFDYEFVGRKDLGNQEYEIVIKHKSDSLNFKDFVIRPILDNGQAEVYVQEKDKWVSQHALFSDLPSLDNNLKVRISGVNVYKTQLYFEIIDKNTLRRYVTPKRTIFGRWYRENYIESINENISSASFEQELLEENPKSNEVDLDVDMGINKIGKQTIYLLLIGGLVSFLGFFFMRSRINKI